MVDATALVKLLSRPLTVWRRRVLAACIVTTFLAPAVAQLLPSVRSRVDEPEIQRPADIPDDASLEASGAIIGQVRHVRLNVFDTTIAAEDTSLFRLANRIHIVTRESVIGAQCSFGPGDWMALCIGCSANAVELSRPVDILARNGDGIPPVTAHSG